MPSSNRRAFLGTGIAVGLGTLTRLGTAQAPETDTTTTADGSDGEDALKTWLAAANDPQTHRIRDLRYDDPPTVYVGMSNTNSFSPPAVKVTPGTTVTWEWVGNDPEYNVVATDDAFDSGQPTSEAGTVFEHTFDAEGAYKYVSEPHADAGMQGVVVVETAPSSEYPTVDEWLAGTNEYDGTITDRTDADLVEIDSGASGNGSQLAFDPHAVTVSTGTTVRWSWTGKGGGHNIVFRDGDFGSEPVRAEPGVHFEETFSETGVFRYACEPHHALGHRGAVIVE